MGLRAILVAVAGLTLLLVGTNQAAANEGGVTAVERNTESRIAPADIQVTERFSIPFGFEGNLTLTDNGDSVVATGEGACKDGEAITIAFTVTQSTSGGSVNGLWDGTCTGAVQTWTHLPEAMSSPKLSEGPATACAFAETSANGGVTDTQDWCDPVTLVSNKLYLPRVLE